jgi:hypothetical protein
MILRINCMGRQELTDVLNRTTNEQRLMRPRPSDGWLNINIFSQELLASGEGGVGVAEVDNFFQTYKTFSRHIVIFLRIQKFFRSNRNFSGNTKISPDISLFFQKYKYFSGHLSLFFCPTYENCSVILS